MQDIKLSLQKLRMLTLKSNSSAYEKYELGHLIRWYIFLKGSKTGTNFQKNKEVTSKTPLFVIHFVVAILFVLTLASERAVLNGNDGFLILVV